MAIRVVCPNPQCQATFSVDDKLAGRHGACPKCKYRIDIPPIVNATTTRELQLADAADEWFYVLDGKETGPITFTKLTELAKSGLVTRLTLVRQSSSKIAFKAMTVQGLFEQHPLARNAHSPPPSPFMQKYCPRIGALFLLSAIASLCLALAAMGRAVSSSPVQFGVGIALSIFVALASVHVISTCSRRAIALLATSLTLLGLFNLIPMLFDTKMWESEGQLTDEQATVMLAGSLGLAQLVFGAIGYLIVLVQRTNGGGWHP